MKKENKHQFLFACRSSKLILLNRYFVIISKMKPLKTTEYVLKWMSMSTPDESASQVKRSAYVAFTLAVHLVNAGAFLSGAAYFLKNMDISMVESLHAMVNFVANINLIVACTYVACFDRAKIAKIFKKLLAIHTNREHLSKKYQKNFLNNN